MIDLHSHILAGIDDGPATLAGSVDMARAAAADGIEAIAATPHVRWDYPTTADAMLAGVEAVRQAVDAEGIPVRVLPGGEIDLDWLETIDDEERRRFGLGGNQRYLLVEFPYTGWPLGLAEAVFKLVLSGIVPVLGHPERNAEVHAAPERLQPAIASGALLQVTAASVDGRIGPRSERCALDLIERGWAHMIASDAHEPSIRAIGLSAAAARLDDEPLARWLTDEVPRAIVEGGDLPPRPERVRRRRRRLWPS